MRIKDELFSRNSVEEFSKDISARVDACTGIIHVRTNELVRAALLCRKLALQEGSAYFEWDIVRGITGYSVEDFTNHTKPSTMVGTQQLPAALHRMLVDEFAELAAADHTVYVCFLDPSAFWGSPAALHYLRIAADMLPQCNMRFIAITEDDPPPESLAELVSTVHLRPPGFQELLDEATELFAQSTDITVDGVDEESMKALCFSGSGMSLNMFADALSLGLATRREGRVVDISSLIDSVGLSKTSIISKSDILELFRTEDIRAIGGMENLKSWVNARKECYSDEAEAFGIEPPKGLVCVGPPGTGKSQVAKAIAGELGVPLVRLDFGRVFNSLVGSSEERMRKALTMVEFMAPVVLFCDEIDKGLGGIGSGGDSGTSSRVLGTFLTWLQECTAPVFTMVTANNISLLPPELMRRGRFDAIFATGLPTAEERMEILNIHMRKRGYDPEKFSERSKNLAVDASKGYVGAEIESAVKDGLIAAFGAGEEFEVAHVTEALKSMIPLSKSYMLEILAISTWAKQNAMPASKSYEVVEDTKVTKMEGRRVRTKKQD